MSFPRPTLAVVPAFVRNEHDMQTLLTALVTLQETAPGTPALVVDDCSPNKRLMDQLAVIAGEVDATVVRNAENSGFAASVNVGLREARSAGGDAVLVNADIEFDTPRWLDALQRRVDTQGRPAAVVGGMLRYPNGLIQHAGVYYSILSRDWDHRFRFGPAALPEAQVPARCPVTAALQLIRNETLHEVGLYDEAYFMGWEDVDYCLRVFAAGLECIYEPACSAVHAESVFRKDPSPELRRKTFESGVRLWSTHSQSDMARFAPAVG